MYQQISFKCFIKEKTGIIKSTFMKQTVEGTIILKYFWQVFFKKLFYYYHGMGWFIQKC